MKKRLLALLCVLAMVFPIAAGAEGFDLKGKPSEDPLAPMEERITMTIGKLEGNSIKYDPGETVDNNYIINFYRDVMNIDYQFAWTSLDEDSYNQKAALTITMGDLPDVMQVNAAQLRQLVKADLIADLTDVLETYAHEHLRGYIDSSNGISISGATFDGRVMAIPGCSPGADGIPMLYVRGDWMEKYNLEDPKTLEDIINIAKVFKENEGTGLVACNKIVNVGNNAYGLDALFALFGSYPELWVTDKDGKLTYGSIMPETKTALAEIAKLVQDAVLSRDFVVYDVDMCNEMITSGKAGIFFAPWWYYNWPLSDMVGEDESVEWRYYLAPLTEEGKYNTHMQQPTTSYVVARKDYPHLDAFVKTMNAEYMYGSMNLEIPRPREDAWRSWMAAPITLLQCYYNEKEEKAAHVMAVVNGEATEDTLVAEEKDWYTRYMYTKEVGLHQAKKDELSSGYCFTVTPYLLYQADEAGMLNRVYGASYQKSPTMDKKWATLETLEDEFFLQVIIGDKSVDEFDAFVKQWLDLGGAEITAEMVEMMND